MLPITKSEEFVVDTKVPWFRTGLIIEKGKYYKLTYIAGLTRDGENSPTGPGGQKAGSRDFRSLPFSKPRLSDRKWLFLGAAIAHPRIWTPQEQSMTKALEYLFFRAPPLLLAQIAMIGDDLATADNEIYIWSEAPSGLLYMFVNDFWQTAGDNSGGPRLRISLVDEREIGTGPVHVLWHFTEQAKDVIDGKNEINWWERYQSKKAMPTERPLPPRYEISLWRRCCFRIKEILTAKQIERSDA